jgi:hypothetical protein
LEKVRCFRIRKLLGFLPNVQGRKAACSPIEYMDCSMLAQGLEPARNKRAALQDRAFSLSLSKRMIS